jgi:hypothetical protein
MIIPLNFTREPRNCLIQEVESVTTRRWYS